MAALPPRRLMSVMASGEMTMSIECQAPLSSHWMRTPGVEMRTLARVNSSEPIRAETPVNRTAGRRDVEVEEQEGARGLSPASASP